MTAVAVAPAGATAVPDRARPLAWLRERGMGATILVAGLSSGFGALLLIATACIALALRQNPLFGDSASLSGVVAILSILLMGIAVYVAAIVTANTFATIVAGRVRQIALLRLIGASAASQRTAVARQGLVVGALGAVSGLLVSVVAGLGLVGLAEHVFDLTLGAEAFPPTLVIPAVGVALTTWAAAWVGSRRVLTVTPLEALGNAAERTSEELHRPARTTVAVVLMVFGILLIAAGVFLGLMTSFGVIVAFLGGLVSFTGLTLGAAVIMPPVLRLVGRAFGSSATARLAAENAMRHPERSSRMAIGVVMGVALVSMFAVASESAKALLVRSAGGNVPTEVLVTMDAFAGVMMALVGLSAVIAAVGLVNLLTIGVVQRRRELGLLRALGLTGAQVRRVVLLEAAHITTSALVVGLLLGVLYGWAGAQATLGSVAMPPSFSAPTFVVPAVPWLVVAGIVAATTVLTLVAAVVPTRLATRIAPVEALAAT